MILDKQNRFSDAQAVTASAASTDIIDLGPLTNNTERDIGAGRPIYLVVNCHTTADSAGDAATVTIKLQTDTVEAMNTPATDIFTSQAFAQAAVVAGTRLVCVAVPRGVKRYLRVYYTIGTENLTAGKFDAFLTLDPQDTKVYADNYVRG